MNLIKRHKILSIVVGVLAVIIIASVAAAVGGGSSSTTAPATHTPPAATRPHTPAPKKPAQSERADLNYLNLEDKSVAGLTDIWVKWSVTNHSSKASDYWISWEALNASGVRVADGSELTSNVQPGQTAKQDSPTTLDTTHVKLVVTKFDRTQNYG